MVLAISNLEFDSYRLDGDYNGDVGDDSQGQVPFLVGSGSE